MSFIYNGVQFTNKADPNSEVELGKGALDALGAPKGARRNILKMQIEWAWAQQHRDKESSHGGPITALIDWFVGQFRHAPYLWGHIVVFWLLLREGVLNALLAWLLV